MHIQQSQPIDAKEDYEKALEDFGLYAGDDFRAVYGWYRLWVRSGFVALPYSGGVAEQPDWVIHDFNVFTLIEGYLKLMEQRSTNETSNTELMEEGVYFDD